MQNLLNKTAIKILGVALCLANGLCLASAGNPVTAQGAFERDFGFEESELQKYTGEANYVVYKKLAPYIYYDHSGNKLQTQTQNAIINGLSDTINIQQGLNKYFPASLVFGIATAASYYYNMPKKTTAFLGLCTLGSFANFSRYAILDAVNGTVLSTNQNKDEENNNTALRNVIKILTQKQLATAKILSKNIFEQKVGWDGSSTNKTGIIYLHGFEHNYEDAKTHVREKINQDASITGIDFNDRATFFGLGFKYERPLNMGNGLDTLMSAHTIFRAQQNALADGNDITNIWAIAHSRGGKSLLNCMLSLKPDRHLNGYIFVNPLINFAHTLPHFTKLNYSPHLFKAVLDAVSFSIPASDFGSLDELPTKSINAPCHFFVAPSDEIIPSTLTGNWAEKLAQVDKNQVYYWSMEEKDSNDHNEWIFSSKYPAIMGNIIKGTVSPDALNKAKVFSK